MTRHFTQRRYAVIEAPSILGLKPTGVDRLPQALLDNHLADRLDARYAGRVEPLSYSHDRDAATSVLNARAIAEWSPQLADAIGRVVDNAEFPLVLGGDCSILLGAMLALKRRGRFGLLFIDGHADFYQPAANPTAGEDGIPMDLLRRGVSPSRPGCPALLTDLEGRGPLVRPSDTVAFGFRDAHEQRHYGSQPLAADVLALDLMTVRRMGVERAVQAALERIVRPENRGLLHSCGCRLSRRPHHAGCRLPLARRLQLERHHRDLADGIGERASRWNGSHDLQPGAR